MAGEIFWFGAILGFIAGIIATVIAFEAIYWMRCR